MLAIILGALKQIKGMNLKRLRESHNLKQKDIAEMINQKDTNVSAMEHGKRAISDRVINMLCEKLNIQPYEFFINHETPVLRDENEARHIYEYREAGKLKIVDKVDSYMSYIIREKQREKKEGTEDERLSESG